MENIALFSLIPPTQNTLLVKVHEHKHKRHFNWFIAESGKFSNGERMAVLLLVLASVSLFLLEKNGNKVHVYCYEVFSLREAIFFHESSSAISF